MGCCGDERVGPISAMSAPIVRRGLRLLGVGTRDVVSDPTYVHDFFTEGPSGPVWELVVYVKDNQQMLIRGSSGGSGSASDNCDFLKSRAPDPGTAWRYMFEVPQGWSNRLQNRVVGPGNLDQATYDDLTRDATYVCTMQATSKGPVSAAAPPSGSASPSVSLYVTGNAQSEVLVPCGGRASDIRTPFELLVVVANKGARADTFTTKIYNGGDLIASRTETIEPGAQKGYTVNVATSKGSVDAQVTTAGGASAECAAAIGVTTTPPPPPPPPGTPPPDSGPPTPATGVVTGPAGLVALPAPLAGSSFGRVASIAGTARRALLKWGVLKSKQDPPVRW